MEADNAGGANDLKQLPAVYAAWRQSSLGRITDTLEQALILDLIGPPAGKHILDVGCGDGVLAVELARRGARVTGIDPSFDMIAAARERAAKQGKSVTFEIATAAALPFEAESFDAVTAVTVLCFIDDPGAGPKEMARVLRAGGRLIVGELGRWNVWAPLRRLRGWLGSSIWQHARFRTAAELRALASEAGLVEANVTGAIYYPPNSLAARLLAPIDRALGRLTTFGAAFLVLSAVKPLAQGEIDRSEN